MTLLPINRRADADCTAATIAKIAPPDDVNLAMHAAPGSPTRVAETSNTHAMTPCRPLQAGKSP